MRINYQSDFKIIEKNLNGDVNTPSGSLTVQSCRDVLLRSLTGTGTRTAVGLMMVVCWSFLTGMDFVPALCRSNANTIFLMLILPKVSAILYRWRLQVLSSFPARRMRAQQRSCPIRIMPHTMRCRAYLCQIRSMMMC